MQRDDRFQWQLRAPQPTTGEAIEAALALDEAKLTYGPYLFDFAKRRSPSGELVLTLTPNSGPYPDRRPVLIGHERHEQVVPEAPDSISAVVRGQLEARYLQTLGRALCNDVAALIRWEMRLP